MTPKPSCIDITETKIKQLAEDYARSALSSYPTTKESFIAGFVAAVELIAQCSTTHDKLKLISEV